MKKLLAFAAIAEAATGAALVVVPLLVSRMLLGAEFSGVGVIGARVAGIALIALGVACWPYGAENRGLCGMLTYSALVTAYLAWVGLAGVFRGVLLWPAIILHVLLTILLAKAWLRRT